jgi:hypothetical protein
MERHTAQVFGGGRQPLKPSAFTGALSKIGARLRIGRQASDRPSPGPRAPRAWALPPLCGAVCSSVRAVVDLRRGVGGGHPFRVRERVQEPLLSCTAAVPRPNASSPVCVCVCSHSAGAEQEDAHEFLRLVMEGMHLADLAAARFDASPYSRHAQSGVLHGIFGGHLRSQVRCETCQFNSNTYDAFLDLSLEIKKRASLEDALSHFTKSEVLDGPNKYKCSNCGVKSRATKRFTVHRAPLVLSVHLKRFETSWGGHASKINKHVRFGQSLSLGDYMSQGERADAQYALYAVLVHTGASTRSGHYFSFVRPPPPSRNRGGRVCAARAA